MIVGTKLMLPIPVLALALTFLFPAFITAAPGDLDPAFGLGGRVFTNIAIINPPANDHYPVVSRMLVQPDGRILVCGSYWEDAVSEYYGLFILRYMPDGTLDSSFASQGILKDLQFLLYANDMALQADGKIVVTGGNQGRIFVRRFTSSGTLDKTFGNHGTTIYPSNPLDEGSGLAIQSDGKIVVTGNEFSFTSPSPKAVLFRLIPTGQFDNSFGTAGTGILQLGPANIKQPLVQSDGKILFTVVESIEPYRGSIVRYNPDGTPDHTFGNEAIVWRPTSELGPFNDLVLQPDGKIVAAWETYSKTTTHTSIARYLPNGRLDRGFGASGGLLSLFGTFSSPALDISVAGNGHIHATGFARPAGGRLMFAALRLLPNGFLDPGFGIGGRSFTLMNAGATNDAIGSAGALQPDGKVLVAGSFGFYFTDSHEYIAIARLLGGETPKLIEASVSGRVSTASGRGISSARLMLVDELGNTRYAHSNPFGYFRFIGVTAGLNYQVTVASKRHAFAEPTQTFFLSSSLTNLDFVSNP